MSIPKPPEKAKMIVSIITGKGAIISRAMENLEKLFGQIDYISKKLPFDHTDYYNKEMDQHLFRKYVSFVNLVCPENLAHIKVSTNSVEQNFLNDAGGRMANVDPGIITAGNLILATGKNYNHRIYLSKGIYAEVTLIYKGGSFRPLEWTYPDYASKEIIEIFNNLRKRYLIQLRNQEITHHG